MGNAGGPQQFHFQSWRVVGNIQCGEVIRNGSEEAELYSIRIPSENLSSQLDIYHKRQNKPGCMVRVLAYLPNPSFTCGQNHTYLVVTQRLIRIQELEQLCYQQSINLIKQVLIQYQTLSESFGEFEIKASMIGKSSEGYIKLWINENMGSNQVEECLKQRQADIQVVRRVCEIVSDQTRQEERDKVSDLFSKQKYRKWGISRIVDEISDMQVGKKVGSKLSVDSNNSAGRSGNQSNPSVITFGKIPSTTFCSQEFKEPDTYKYQPSIHLLPPLKPLNYSVPLPDYQRYSPPLTSYSYSHQYIPPQPSFLSSTQEYPIGNLKLISQSSNKVPISPIVKQEILLSPLASTTNIPTLTYIPRGQLKSPINGYNSMYSTVNPKLQQTQAQTLTQFAADTLKPPIVPRVSQDDKSMDDMTLINSHIYVTNQDLYQNMDSIVKGENLKIEESAILRRLSKRSKENQEDTY